MKTLGDSTPYPRPVAFDTADCMLIVCQGIVGPPAWKYSTISAGGMQWPPMLAPICGASCVSMYEFDSRLGRESMS